MEDVKTIRNIIVLSIDKIDYEECLKILTKEELEVCLTNAFKLNAEKELMFHLNVKLMNLSEMFLRRVDQALAQVEGCENWYVTRVKIKGFSTVIFEFLEYI